MFNYKQFFIAMVVLSPSAGALANSTGLSAEMLKVKPVEKINAKEPARPALKGAMASQSQGVAARPQTAASHSQKENLNKAAYLKNIIKGGKPTLGGEGGSSSQGCMNCNN